MILRADLGGRTPVLSCSLLFERSCSRARRRFRRNCRNFRCPQPQSAAFAWTFTRQRPVRAPVDGFGISKNTALGGTDPLWDFWSPCWVRATVRRTISGDPSSPPPSRPAPISPWSRPSPDTQPGNDGTLRQASGNREGRRSATRARSLRLIAATVPIRVFRSARFPSSPTLIGIFAWCQDYPFHSREASLSRSNTAHVCLAPEISGKGARTDPSSAREHRDNPHLSARPRYVGYSRPASVHGSGGVRLDQSSFPTCRYRAGLHRDKGESGQ